MESSNNNDQKSVPIVESDKSKVNGKSPDVDIKKNVSTISEKEIALNKAYRGFFTHLGHIVEQNQNSKINPNLTKISVNTAKTNPALAALKKYITTYNRTSPWEHIEFFMAVYQKYRSAIKIGYKNDEWLKVETVNIRYGDSKSPIRIPLSMIYNLACKIRDLVKEELKGLPDEMYEDKVELIYPDVFMLHLYRVFYECVIFHQNVKFKDDANEIKTIIQEIEKELKVEPEAELNTTGSGMMGGIMNMATKVMGQLGIKPPENAKLPSEQELGNVITSVFDNPNTKSVIGGIFNNLKDCTDIGQVMNKLAGTLADPKLSQAIKDTVAPITEQAIKTQQENNSKSQNVDSQNID